MTLSVNQRLYSLLQPDVYSLSLVHQEKIQKCLDEGLDYEDPSLSYQIVSMREISNRCFMSVLSSSARFDIPNQQGQTALHLLARFRKQVSYLKDVLNRYDCVFEAIQTSLLGVPTAVNHIIESYLGSKKDAVNLEAMNPKSGKGETPLHEALFNGNLPGAELLASETRLSLPYFNSGSLGGELSKLRGQKSSLWFTYRIQALEVEFSRGIGNESLALNRDAINQIVTNEFDLKFRVIRDCPTHWVVEERPELGSRQQSFEST